VKLLLIRFSSIGDIVLTSPILRCLKKQYPGVEIHFLVKQKFRSVIEHNPYVDKLHVFDKDLKDTVAGLKKENIDFIIDLQKNFRSQKIKRRLGKPGFSFSKLNLRKWVYVNLKLNLMPDKSIVSRYFRAVKPLKVYPDGRGLDFFIPEHLKTKQDDIPMSHWAGFVGCVTGGSFFTKKFPVEKWKDFCARCPFPIILLGGPEDREAGDEIAKTDPGKIYNACGKFSLLESADLVRRAKVIISNDTGLMHIAAAFQKPIISLWGNTTPDMGMFPYYGQNNLRMQPSPLSVMIEHKPLSCRPCSKLGFQKCPKKHFKCMNELPVGIMFDQVKAYWKNKP
jgi:heptosyltransferase-2